MLDCPEGTFIGAGVKTVVLFFKKGTKPRQVWCYQLAPSKSSGQARNLGKTNPLNDADLAEVIALQASRASADEVAGDA